MKTNNDITPDAVSSSRKFFKTFNNPNNSSGSINSTSMNTKNNFFNLLIGGSGKNWKNAHRRLSDFSQINKVSCILFNLLILNEIFKLALMKKIILDCKSFIKKFR